MIRILQSIGAFIGEIIFIVLIVKILTIEQFGDYSTYYSTFSIILIPAAFINSKIIANEPIKKKDYFIFGGSLLILASTSIGIGYQLNLQLITSSYFLTTFIFIFLSSLSDAIATRDGFLPKSYIGTYISSLIKIILALSLNLEDNSTYVISIIILIASFTQLTWKLRQVKLRIKRSLPKLDRDNSKWHALNPAGVYLFFGFDIVILNLLGIQKEIIGVFSILKQIVSVFRQIANSLVSLDTKILNTALEKEDLEEIKKIRKNYRSRILLAILLGGFGAHLLIYIKILEIDIKYVLFILILLAFNWENRLNTQILLLRGKEVSKSTLFLIITGIFYLASIIHIHPNNVYHLFTLFFIFLFIKSFIDKWLVTKIFKN